MRGYSPGRSSDESVIAGHLPQSFGASQLSDDLLRALDSPGVPESGRLSPDGTSSRGIAHADGSVGREGLLRGSVDGIRRACWRDKQLIDNLFLPGLLPARVTLSEGEKQFPTLQTAQI